MKRKIRNKVKLHPVMSVLIIIFGVIILSLLLSIFNFSFSYTSINSSRGEYISTTESIINLFSLHGLKYIFGHTSIYGDFDEFLLDSSHKDKIMKVYECLNNLEDK